MIYKDIIFYSEDTERFDEKNMKCWVPILVPQEFYTIKTDYSKGGKLVKYLLTRFNIPIHELLNKNNPTMLFMEITDDEEYIIKNYCDGSLTYGEIEEIVTNKFSGIESSGLNIFFERLTKQRLIFWIKYKNNKTIDKFHRHLCENYHASAMSSEILYSYNYKAYGIPYMFAPSKVSFVITDKCNARCKTCYRGNIKLSQDKKYKNELSTDELFRIIDELKMLGTDRIKFLGGEPFCRLDLFDLLMEAHNQNLMTEISSNGTLLANGENIEKIKHLKKSLFNLQISIDGLEMAQNRQRTGADFNCVVQAFENLKNNNIRFTTNTIVSRINMGQIDEFVKFLSEYKVASRFQIMKACGTGYDNFINVPSPYEKQKLIYDINNAAIKYNANINNSVTFHPFADEKIEKRSDIKVNYHRCRACTYGIAISPQGYALPCEFLEPFNEFIGDNIHDKGILDIWHESELFRKFRYVKVKDKCTECAYNYICEMGCFAEIYSLTGRLDSPDPVCWYIPNNEQIIFPKSNDYIFGNIEKEV